MILGGDDVDEWRSLNKNKNSEELSYVAAGKLDFWVWERTEGKYRTS
jgi:hypothetical protein